jgi:ParB/RepB/Spo0J family partition protein
MGNHDRTGYQMVPVTQIRESAANPRTHFDQAALAELTESIRAHGVMVPLLVRPVDDHYELVDGARRLRAAIAAGLSDVPVVNAAREDAEAREAALVANLQRADVPPLDEARAFFAMHVAAGLTATDLVFVQHLAKQVGKTPKYVWDRLQLLDLVPIAQQLLEAGRLTIPHVTLLARLSAEQQERAIREGLFEHEAALSLLEDDGLGDFEDLDDTGMALRVSQFAGRKARTARELEAWIARNIRFNVHQAATASPLDFGAVAERVGEATAQPGRGKKVVYVTYDHFVQPEAKADGERTYCQASWRRADGRDDSSPTCDRSILGLVVVGPCYGETFPVCIDKNCDAHWLKERRQREKVAKQMETQAASGDKRRESEEAKFKSRQEREQRERETWLAAAPALLEATSKAIATAKPLDLAVFLLERHPRDHQAAAEKHLGASKTAETALRHLVFIELAGYTRNTWSGPREFPRIAKAFGIDVPSILKAQAAPSEPAAPKAAKKRAEKITPKTAASKGASKTRGKKTRKAR